MHKSELLTNNIYILNTYYNDLFVHLMNLFHILLPLMISTLHKKCAKMNLKIRNACRNLKHTVTLYAFLKKTHFYSN